MHLHFIPGISVLFENMGFCMTIQSCCFKLVEVIMQKVLFSNGTEIPGNGFHKVCEKNNRSPLKPSKQRKNKEIKPNFEGSYFTIVFGNFAHIWYVGY